MIATERSGEPPGALRARAARSCLSRVPHGRCALHFEGTAMPEDSITLGDVEITRVVEWSGPISTARVIIPDSDEETWQRNEEWLAPDFWTPADDAYRCHIQIWVLRSVGRTILVDTGVGNDRERPQVPQFAGLCTGYLDRLREAGVTPEDVGVVVNTHIH